MCIRDRANICTSRYATFGHESYRNITSAVYWVINVKCTSKHENYTTSSTTIITNNSIVKRTALVEVWGSYICLSATVYELSYTGDRRSRNWFQKLVQEQTYTRLTDTRASLSLVSCNRRIAQVSARYKFLGISISLASYCHWHLRWPYSSGGNLQSTAIITTVKLFSDF